MTRKQHINLWKMAVAVEEIRKLHSPEEYLNPFCILDSDNCDCCKFDVCSECNSHYPCPTIVILNKYIES